MDHFEYRDGQLFCENIRASDLAERFGTPLYVYSKATLLHHYGQVVAAFAELNPTICFSIKSLGNIHICRLLAEAGCGFDVTSGGELFRALKAGGDPSKCIYAGVGKRDDEIRFALENNLAAFNVESEAELENIDRIACAMGKSAVGALRINPDVDPKTHHHTTTGKKESKFGVDLERAVEVFERYRGLKHLRLAGVHMHLGSPIYEVQPYVDAVKKINGLIDRLRAAGHAIEWFDVGGGFGIDYERQGRSKEVGAFAAELVPLLRGRGYRVALEPGRYIAGNAGLLLSRVLYRKTGGTKKFVIADAAMNDLFRPVLYDSFHYIWPTSVTAEDVPARRDRDFAPPGSEVVDIVGPICESTDYLAKGRTLPVTKRGDLLAIFTAGAYGFSMSSNYNNRPRAAEVLVDGNDAKLIRRRETYDDLIAPENV